MRDAGKTEVDRGVDDSLEADAELREVVIRRRRFDARPPGCCCFPFTGVVDVLDDSARSGLAAATVLSGGGESTVPDAIVVFPGGSAAERNAGR